MVARRKPEMVVRKPRARTKTTRGWLLLQMEWRMKFGWDWPRKAAVTIVRAGRRADLWREVRDDVGVREML